MIKNCKHVGIGLLGKGSTNHLHRHEVVSDFKSRGFCVTFIVREDYLALLSQLDGCVYIPFHIRNESGWRAAIIENCQDVRHMYPSWDKGHKKLFDGRIWESKKPWNFIRNSFCRFAAHFKTCVDLAARIEALLFRPKAVIGLEPEQFDMLLLLGIGTVNSELEGVISLWADQHSIPVIHITGNYDNLTSKGFRGILPDRLLVWGPQMVEDATVLHGIPAERLRVIGSIRYNSIRIQSGSNRNEFLKRIGLDPKLKTIVFAGFVYDSQYFEMLEIYRQLIGNQMRCQLILRLYPNKSLMNSIYILPIVEFAKSLPHVYVSFADPHFRQGSREHEVLKVEESDLWNILRNCDVLIDYFSTIALEGAIFDKPVVHMHYLPKKLGKYSNTLLPVEYWNLIHNRRIMSYGAVDIAHDRKELISLIRKNIAYPARHSEARKKMVARECGPIDGKACERLIDECVKYVSKFE